VIEFRDFEPHLASMLGMLYRLVDNFPSAEICETAAHSLQMLVECDVNFIAAIGASGLIAALSRAAAAGQCAAPWVPAYLSFLAHAVAVCPAQLAHELVIAFGPRRIVRLALARDRVAVPAIGVVVGALQIEDRGQVLGAQPRIFDELCRNDADPIRRTLREFADASWERKCAVLRLMRALAERGNLEAVRAMIDAGALKKAAAAVEASRSRPMMKILVETLVGVLETAKLGGEDYTIVRDVIRKEGIAEYMEMLLEDEDLADLAAEFFRKIEEDEEEGS
jgi:hypothetical protein